MRFIDAFVDWLDLSKAGFAGAEADRPSGCAPGDLLKLYIRAIPRVLRQPPAPPRLQANSRTFRSDASRSHPMTVVLTIVAPPLPSAVKGIMLARWSVRSWEIAQ